MTKLEIQALGGGNFLVTTTISTWRFIFTSLPYSEFQRELKKGLAIHVEVNPDALKWSREVRLQNLFELMRSWDRVASA